MSYISYRASIAQTTVSTFVDKQRFPHEARLASSTDPPPQHLYFTSISPTWCGLPGAGTARRCARTRDVPLVPTYLVHAQDHGTQVRDTWQQVTILHSNKQTHRRRHGTNTSEQPNRSRALCLCCLVGQQGWQQQTATVAASPADGESSRHPQSLRTKGKPLTRGKAVDEPRSLRYCLSSAQPSLHPAWQRT